MASGAEKPDLEAAIRELEEVLRRLEVELAGWRRRALQAEARLGDLMRTDGGSRIGELEGRNDALEQRVRTASERLGELISRLTFLEEQRNGGGGE